jgi:hypothetical protein
MNKVIFNLISANEHKSAEAVQAGVGTVAALRSVVGSFVEGWMPGGCQVM